MKNIAQAKHIFYLKFIIIIGLMAGLSYHSNAQSISNIDSLKNRLESTVDPGEKVELLVSIIDAYSGDDNEIVSIIEDCLVLKGYGNQESFSIELR